MSGFLTQRFGMNRAPMMAVPLRGGVPMQRPAAPAAPSIPAATQAPVSGSFGNKAVRVMKKGEAACPVCRG